MKPPRLIAAPYEQLYPSLESADFAEDIELKRDGAGLVPMEDISDVDVSDKGGFPAQAGIGKPMGGERKGHWRPLHDGGGLCSLGRWPISSRVLPTSLVRVQAMMSSWFLKWCEQRDVIRLVMEGACRCWKGSPFDDSIQDLRTSVDACLEELGFEVRKQSSDQPSCIHFCRLQALLKLAGDVDHSYLLDMASSGVPIGIGCKLPRVDQVFERKVKWSVPLAEPWEDMHSGSMNQGENYKSAKDALTQ
eukprot:2298398-Amphidinium_carterae.1